MSDLSKNAVLHSIHEPLLAALASLGYDTANAIIQAEPYFIRVANLKEPAADKTDGSSLVQVEIYSPGLNYEWVQISAEWESALVVDHASKITKAGHLTINHREHGYIARQASTPIEQSNAQDEKSCLHTLMHLAEYLLSFSRASRRISGDLLMHGFLTPQRLTMEAIPRLTWISGLNLGKLKKVAGGSDIMRFPYSGERTDPYAIFRYPEFRDEEPGAAGDLWAACVIALWQAVGDKAFLPMPKHSNENEQFCSGIINTIKKSKPHLAEILAGRLSKPKDLKKPEACTTLADECAQALEKCCALSSHFEAPSKGILVVGGRPDDPAAQWVVTDTRPEDFEVRYDFLNGPDNPILITGPTGTGKSELARQIHNHIYPGNARFRQVNCSLLTRELMISQVFGHLKGSFTDAYRESPGILQECATGTVFFDEIDRLDKDVQGRLLTVLDKGHSYCPLGGEGEDAYKKKCTATLIFATNKNMDELIASKTLEADMYYRISHFFAIDLKPITTRQQALEHAMRIHWDEKTRHLNAMDFGSLEDRFPEAWKVFTNLGIVRYAGNYRDIIKLVTEVIFRLKAKKLRKELVAISGEEAREILLLVDHEPAQAQEETPFNDLSMQDQLAKLADVVFANPEMKRNKAAKLLGLGTNVNPINRLIEKLNDGALTCSSLPTVQQDAMAKFCKARKQGNAKKTGK